MKPSSVRDRFDKLTRMGCIACRLDYSGWQAPQIHHIREGQGLSQRASDEETIPLCPKHHVGEGFDPSVHGSYQEFKEAYGSELELLAKVNRLLEDIE